MLNPAAYAIALDWIEREYEMWVEDHDPGPNTPLEMTFFAPSIEAWQSWQIKLEAGATTGRVSTLKFQSVPSVMLDAIAHEIAAIRSSILSAEERSEHV